MPQFNPVLLSFDTKLYLFYTGSNILVAFPLNNIIEQVKEERHERHKEGAVSCWMSAHQPTGITYWTTEI